MRIPVEHCMTAGELANLLAQLPEDTPCVAVDGRGSYNKISLLLCCHNDRTGESEPECRLFLGEAYVRTGGVR